MANEKSGEIDGAMASGGDSAGDAYPHSKSGKKLGFDGGQTEQGYRGSGQLGNKKVGDGSSDAPSASTDK